MNNGKIIETIPKTLCNTQNRPIAKGRKKGMKLQIEELIDHDYKLSILKDNGAPQ